MATRKTTGVSYEVSKTLETYPAGSAAPAGSKVSNVSLSTNASSTGLAFNGHAVEVWADGAVWDTVSSVYLFPGKDYNPGDIGRK